MIIDINGYHGNWPYWQLRDHEPPAMLAQMDRLNIDYVFLSSLKSVFSDPDGGNVEISTLVEMYPNRFYPAFTFSPYATNWDMFQKACENSAICLVKLFPMHHTYDPLEEPPAWNCLYLCGERDIPVLIPRRLLMSWRMPLFDINRIDNLAKKFPETTFILGSINYLAELQTAFHLMCMHENIYIETSAMMALREVEYVISQVGADRILFGSAIPLQNPAIAPLRIEKAEISDADKENIYYRNALRLFPKIKKNKET